MERLAAIKTQGLTKYYGLSRGVEDLSFSVAQGSIFGFLGANGSGKTTTIRLLLGLLFPTRGQLNLLGLSIQKNRQEILKEIGYLPGEFRLYPHLTGEGLLDLAASFYPQGQAGREQALEALELSRKDLQRPFQTYSLGMKQKLGLLQAFQHKPSLLILDEPTTGLDPLIRRNVYQLLQEVNDLGTTVFFSSHHLSEVEDCCDEVAILNQGRLVVWESLALLKDQRPSQVSVRFSQKLEQEALHMDGIRVLSFTGEAALLEAAHLQPLLEVLSFLPVTSLEIRRASLEEIFWEYYQERG